MNSRVSQISVVGISALALGLSTIHAVAQNDAADGFTIEEIVVTAQKREAAVTDIPSSINVIGGDIIADMNLQNARDFILLTPGAAIQESSVGITTDITLRGVGTPGDLVEPGVGVYIDEMYAGGLRTVTPQFYDMERVEVLRGTQAGLYGRNAVGGAFLYVTRRPVQEFEGRAELRYGSNDLTELSGTVNAPLTDTTAIRLTGWALQQDDGDVTNGITGDSLNERDLYGGRLSASIGLGDTSDLLLTVEHSTEDRPTGQLFYIPGTPTIVGGLEDIDNVYRDTDSRFDTEFTRFTGRLDIETGIGTWTTILGYRTYELDALEDQDFSARNFGEIDPATQTVGTFANRDLDRDESIDSTYAEIRLASPAGASPLDWMIGVNYFGESGDFTLRQITRPPLLGGPNIFLPVPPFDPAFTQENTAFDRLVSQDTDSIAAFVTMGYDLTEKWNVSGAVRYTDDSKDSDYTLTVGSVTGALTGATSFSAAPSDSFTNVSPEISLTYAVNDDWNLYARAAAGFRAGGINVLISDPAAFAYEDETSVNYELGAKGRLFGGRGQLAVAGFLTERDDVLLGFTPAALQFALQNAGESESYGLEVDFDYLITDGFTVGANLGVYGSEITSVDPGFLALEGSDLPFLPDTTLSLLANYNRPITPSLNLLWSVNFRYRDGGYLDTFNTTDMPSYELLNVTMGIGGERWSLIAYGDNVTDDTYQLTTQPFVLAQSIASLAPPPAYETFPGQTDNAGAAYGVRFIYEF